MKHYAPFLFLIAILYSQTSISQVERRPSAMLYGLISDSSGHPLRGVSITLHDVRRGAVSDSLGRYRTSAILPGRYVVEVSYTGYHTDVQTVTISGTTEKSFMLHPAVTEQENVTVTGVSTATSTRRSPQPVVVLRRAQMLGISSTNIINSLSRIPGVNAVTTGPAVSKPFIRGLGYNRVLTINDGVRQEGQQWGDEHGIEIDDYSAQRIEVLKGPASLVYGSDALAGVVNIQTLLPAAEGTIHAEALSEYQTNNDVRGFYGNVAGTKKGFSWGAYGSYKAAEDYKNKYDGPVFNSRFYNRNVGGMLGYSGAWGHSYLMTTYFNQHAGIVEGSRDSATGAFIKDLPGGTTAIATGADFNTIAMQVPYQYIQHFKLTSDNSFRLGKSRIDLIVGYQRNQRQELGNADAPQTPEAYFDLETLTYAVRYNLPYTGNWKNSFGITGMAQGNTNRAEEAIIPNYDLLDAGGYFFTQYSKGKWNFSGGLRYDNRYVSSQQMLEGTDIKFNSFTRNFYNISGNAGFSYLASNILTLKLNVARGFRAPSLAELSSNGAHEGTARYEVGDNNLKSEVSLQTDAGLELNTSHITMGASVFYNHISRFIFYEKMLSTGGSDSLLIDADGNELMVYRFNQRTANLYGAEAHLDIHPHPLDWLHIENSFSYTRARFAEAVEGSRNVPLIPAARLLSTIRGNFFPKGKTLRNLNVSIESDFTGRQPYAFTGFNTETPTGSYHLLNAYIGGDVVNKRGKTVFSIYLSGMNLGDVAYQAHLSRLKYADVNNRTGRQGVFNMGRNFGVKLNVPMDFTW